MLDPQNPNTPPNYKIIISNEVLKTTLKVGKIRSPTSLAIQETETKTIMRYHYTPENSYN
jgi:hypothetical protein